MTDPSSPDGTGASKLTSSAEKTEASPEDAADLIQQAFLAARDTGRPEWWRMTTAVLKNRLLDLTDRQFNEADWGADSFREFLSAVPHLVSIDDSSRPATVELASRGQLWPDDPPQEESVDHPDRRLRTDLWDAVLDYSSRSLYVWDGESAVSVPRQDADAEERPALPTITEAEFAEWQAEFLRTVGATDEAKRAAEGRPVPSRSLPGPARRSWNGEIKRRVLSRLRNWFDEESLPIPLDLVETIPAERGSPDDNEALRSALVRSIQSMSGAELDRVMVPASALLRLPKA